MPFDRRLLTHFEWILPLLVLTVCGLGVLTVYSATHAPGTGRPSGLALRQMTYFAGGVVGMLMALTFDYRRLESRAWIVYAGVLLMVLAVPFIGDVAGGSRRWIRVGPISLQPSEFVKVAVVILIARMLSHTAGVRLGLREAIPGLIFAGIPAAAILIQPDLGSAALVGMVAVTLLAVGGVRLRWFMLLASPVVMAAPLLWGHLKEYQQKRILTFLDPDQDPLGAGYHVIQSKIAVGSGGVWGRGFLRGTQNHLNFLPEQHTDFIFSVFSEEWGLIGAVGLLGLYFALMARMLVIASRSRDRFGVLLCVGVATIVFWQVVVNIGMVTGIMPVVGIPLPFFSYGGSSLVCLLIAIGLVMNVSMRRFLF
jgi:rod shape determining protein RodA